MKIRAAIWDGEVGWAEIDAPPSHRSSVGYVLVRVDKDELVNARQHQRAECLDVVGQQQHRAS